MKMPTYYFKSAQIVTSLEYQNNLQLLEKENMNLSPREALIISSGYAKDHARPFIVKEQKGRGRVSYVLFLNSNWPIVQA